MAHRSFGKPWHTVQDWCGKHDTPNANSSLKCLCMQRTCNRMFNDTTGHRLLTSSSSYCACLILLQYIVLLTTRLLFSFSFSFSLSFFSSSLSFFSHSSLILTRAFFYPSDGNSQDLGSSHMFCSKKPRCACQQIS